MRDAKTGATEFSSTTISTCSNSLNSLW